MNIFKYGHKVISKIKFWFVYNIALIVFPLSACANEKRLYKTYACFRNESNEIVSPPRVDLSLLRFLTPFWWLPKLKCYELGFCRCSGVVANTLHSKCPSHKKCTILWKFRSLFFVNFLLFIERQQLNISSTNEKRKIYLTRLVARFRRNRQSLKSDDIGSHLLPPRLSFDNFTSSPQTRRSSRHFVTIIEIFTLP